MKPLLKSILFASVMTLALPFMAQSADLGPISDEKVYFRGWPYKPEVVDDNVKRYNSEVNGNIDYQTVTHGDYPTLMEKSLIAGDKLDIIYANPATAVRFLEAGWISPADDVPNIEQIKADMYDNAKNAFTYKGKLLGLSYFLSVRGTMMVNREKQLALGVTDPKDWDEFYAQLISLHERGETGLFMPHWFNEFYGISWAFILEVLNRGDSQIDPITKRPILSADGAAGDTLRIWKRIYNLGIVPQEVISFTEAGIVEGFSSGRFLYSPHNFYNIKIFNDPAQSKIAGKVGFIGYDKQSWGLLDSALYLRTARERSPGLEEDVKRFQSWYGYKDHEGKVAVGQRWANNSILFSAYKTVMESDESKASFKNALAFEGDYERMLALYKAAPYPPVWKMVWAEEYNSFLRLRLGQFLANDEDVNDFIDEMNEKIDRLNKRYKIYK